jgi:site-specific recombinase XerD
MSFENQENLPGVIMNDYLDLFINYLAVEKGLSTNTQEAYSRDLARYLDFLEQQGRSSPASVTSGDVAMFLGRLKDAGIAPRSRARCLSAIRMFHKFLMIENYADANPAAHPAQTPGIPFPAGGGCLTGGMQRSVRRERP